MFKAFLFNLYSVLNKKDIYTFMECIYTHDLKDGNSDTNSKCQTSVFIN